MQALQPQVWNGIRGGLFVLCFWAAIAGSLVAGAWLQPDRLLSVDSDDAMRLVSATDLLQGQAWTDLTQYRDNTPFGASLHWSRLIDAPLALLIYLAKPAFGDAAPDIAAIIWPVLLLLPLLLVTAAIVRRLVPKAGAFTAAALAVLTLAIAVEFLPGRVDHHNVQMVLSLLTLLALVGGRTSSAGGAIAGLAIATSLAIGLETALFLPVATLLYAMCWIGEPQRYRPALMAFAVALALGTSIHFLTATAPVNYLTAACDALSIVHVVAVGCVAIALLAAVTFGTRLARLWQRAALIGPLSAAAAIGAALLFPDCLRGPYAAVDPRLMAQFQNAIDEMQPLLGRLAVDMPTGIGFAAAALVALPVTAWRAWRERGDTRMDWLLVFGFLAAAAAIMIVQIRGARIAAPFAIPAAAWVIAAARQRYRRTLLWPDAGLLAGAWLLFAGVAQFALALGLSAVFAAPAPAPVAGREPLSQDACIIPASYRRLAQLPVGRIMAPTLLGAPILRYTPHSVVSAGFHRNNQGNLDVLAFFGGQEARAYAVARARGIDYVVRCRGVADVDGPIGPASGAVWPWLTPLADPADALQVYRTIR